MTELEVCASVNYRITIEKNMRSFSEKILPLIRGENIAVITDGNVYGIYGRYFDGLLAGKRIIYIVIKSGEKSKNAKNFLKIINALAKAGFTREDGVIAFGGGVIGDLAGFAASAYMRGVTLISVPTTLLAMIDSSVGGKTGIDLTAGKNLCGTFYQPSAVYINLGFLDTLPEKERLNGLGEAVKYAFLSDTVTESVIKEGGEKLVYECLKIKRDVVCADEKESGLRAILNFGHTVGHAIEKLSGYKIPHGLCVAKGMLCAVEVSERFYALPREIADKMKSFLYSFGFNLDKIYSAEKITEAVYADKKRKGESVNFIAVRDFGKPFIEKISLEKLGEILKEYESRDKTV